MRESKSQYNVARDFLKVLAIVTMTADHASTAFLETDTFLYPLLSVLWELHYSDNVLFHRAGAYIYKISAELCIAVAWMGNDLRSTFHPVIRIEAECTLHAACKPDNHISPR